MDALIPDRTSLDVAIVQPEADVAGPLLFHTPDLLVLGLGERIDELLPLFETLEDDPWLAAMSILLVSPDNERAIEVYGRHRISYFLESGNLESTFSRVLGILLQRTDALRGADVVDKLAPFLGEIVLETDLFLVQYYAALFANHLQKEGYLSGSKKYGLQLALIELLVNAMEHGNAGITYEAKTEWLASNRSIQELVEKRMSEPPYQGRKVRLACRISPGCSTFQITDEGEGFNVSSVPDSALGKHLLEAHGRGILTSRGCVDRLRYNEKGNSVTIEVDHDGPRERAVPPGFVDAPPRRLAPGDLVFSEGDVADSLFYIVSGEYDVVVKGKKVLSSSAEDIFIGEMSFLLGRRRSATVIARREGQLVEISRDAFMSAVMKYPGYAVFICRLLAHRLQAAHQRYADAMTKGS